MKRIHEFDGLRTLAVLMVIADHYAPFRNWGNSAPARYGGLGVDIFFVLSGFLITTILLELKNTEHAYKIFYARRMLRILPPFLLLLTFVYGVGFLRHDGFEKTKFLGQMLFLRSFKDTGAVFGQVWLVIRGAGPLPGLFQKVVPGPLPHDYPWLPMSGSLGPTWSLSVEEWFYVLWAPVVLMLGRRAILRVAIAVCACGFVLRWFAGNATEFFSSVDLLIVGAILALWMEQRESLPKTLRARADWWIDICAVLALISFVGLTFLHRDRMSRSLVALFVFGALAWLIRHAKSNHLLCGFLRLRPMVYLGTISYTLYLIHLPMYFVVRSVLYERTATWSPTAQAWAIAACSIIATILFAGASWKFYELPILSFKDVLTDRIRKSRRANVPLKAPPSMLGGALQTETTEQLHG